MGATDCINSRLIAAAERYSVLRRLGPRFLAAFDFRSKRPNDPVLAATWTGGHSRVAKTNSPILPAAAVAQADLRNGPRTGGYTKQLVLATLRDRLRASNLRIPAAETANWAS